MGNDVDMWEMAKTSEKSLNFFTNGLINWEMT